MAWINTHNLEFIRYRALLVIAFACLATLPFSLYRIIVAQEIMAQVEDETGQDDSQEEQEDQAEENDNEDIGHSQEEPMKQARESDSDDGEGGEQEDQPEASDSEDPPSRAKVEIGADGMPAQAWRGKGFAVIAAWAGSMGLMLYLLATAAGTLYLVSQASELNKETFAPLTFADAVPWIAFFSISANTAGMGLLALSTLLFGAMIARAGLRLWPRIWVAFSYVALAVAALLSGSAIGVASSPVSGQATLATPAILLFALWVLWFGIMLVRLRAE
jgi:hypothetical protein